jgi:hypothetical protein
MKIGINENTFLVTGYNEGLGLLFKYLDKQEQKEILARD